MTFHILNFIKRFMITRHNFDPYKLSSFFCMFFFAVKKKKTSGRLLQLDPIIVSRRMMSRCAFPGEVHPFVKLSWEFDEDELIRAVVACLVQDVSRSRLSDVARSFITNLSEDVTVPEDVTIPFETELLVPDDAFLPFIIDLSKRVGMVAAPCAHSTQSRCCAVLNHLLGAHKTDIRDHLFSSTLLPCSGGGSLASDLLQGDASAFEDWKTRRNVGIVQQNVNLRIENMKLRKELEALRTKWMPRIAAAEFIPSSERMRQKEECEREARRKAQFIENSRQQRLRDCTAALNTLFHSKEAQRLEVEKKKAEEVRRLEVEVARQMAADRADAANLVLLCYAEECERSAEASVQEEIWLEHTRIKEAIAVQVRIAEAKATAKLEQETRVKELADQENKRKSEEARQKKKEKRAEAHAARLRQEASARKLQTKKANASAEALQLREKAETEALQLREKTETEALRLREKAEAELQKEELRAKVFEEERQVRLRRLAQKAEQEAARQQQENEERARETKVRNEKMVAKITSEVDTLDPEGAWAVYLFSINRQFGRMEDERSRRFVKSLVQLRKDHREDEVKCRLRNYWSAQRIEAAKKKTPISWIENLPMTSNLAEYLSTIFKDPRCGPELALRTATHYQKNHSLEHNVKFFITWALVPDKIPLTQLLLRAAKAKPDLCDALWSLCPVNADMLDFYLIGADRFESYESKMVKGLHFTSPLDPLDRKIIDHLMDAKPTNRYFVLKLVFQLFRNDLHRDMYQLLLTCLHEVLEAQEEFRASLKEHKDRLMENANNLPDDLVPLLAYCCLLLCD